MAYITRALSAGETLLVTARPHWIYALKALVFGGFWVWAGFLADDFLYERGGHNAVNFAVDLGVITFDERFTPIPFMGAALGLAIFWGYLTVFLSHEVGLTDQRFIHKKGLFSVTLEQIDLDDIRAENVHHGWLGWLLRYGYVHLDSRFTGDLYLPAITKPYEILKEAHRARMRHPEIIYDQKNLDENLKRLERQEDEARTRAKLKSLHDRILNGFKKAA